MTKRVFQAWGVCLLFSGVAMAAEPVTNAAAIEFVRIPAGKFTMGSPEDERGRFANEGPRRAVTITRDFFISRCEITCAQYYRFFLETGYTGKEERETDPDFLAGYLKNNNPPLQWVNLKDSKRPMNWISWFSAVRFCNWLSAKEGRVPVYQFEKSKETNQPPAVSMAHPYDGGYRLPTEAEWEYAARAGTVTPYSFGTDSKLIGEYSPFFIESGRDISEVGQFKPNPWGLFDVHGSVAEWCWDWYGPNYLGLGTSDPVGSETGVQRVVRGGSSNRLAPLYRRSACRLLANPATTRYDLGFRLVYNPARRGR